MKNYYQLYLTNGNGNYGYIEFRDENGNRLFDSSIVIGEEIDGVMYELLTGEEIKETDQYSILPCLTYYKKEPCSHRSITNLYKKMTYERYVEFVKTLRYIEKCNRQECFDFLRAEEELKKYRRLNHE